MPSPIPKMTSLSGNPIGTSTSPPFLIFPASANTFVPLLCAVPMAAKAAPPLEMIQGTFPNVSTLLILVGFCQKSLLSRERRLQSRHSSFAFQGSDQSGFFTAHERTGTSFDPKIKAVYPDPNKFFTQISLFLWPEPSRPQVCGSQADIPHEHR